MENIPFVHVATLVSEIQGQIVPLALRERCDRRKQIPPWLPERLPRLFEWMRLNIDTERMLLAWLHERATMRSWFCVAFAFERLKRFLLDAMDDSRLAREIAAELVACPTTWQVTFVAMRFAASHVRGECSE